MQGNLITTLFAVLIYLTSGLFGGGGQEQPVIPSGNSGINQSIYPYVGTINSQQANIRNEGSASGEVVDTLAAGTRLMILDEKNGWLKIQTENDQTGWIAKWMVEATKPAAGGRIANKVIAGYYVENYSNDPVGYASLSQNLGAINMVIPFSFKVDQYGTISGNHNAKPVSLIRSSGGTALALVNNIQGNNFNSNTIHRMLNSATARTKAISGITRLVVENGYQGVNIDFENVPASDRIYLTAFFRELSAAFKPRGLLVTASVPAKTYDDRSSAHAGAYDYAALAPYIDQLMIMTYDQHYAGGDPGPVASYPWVEKVIQYALQSYSPNKIIMGIAGYGYDWGASSGRARHYSAIQDLIEKHKIAPKWHATYKVPYFTYRSWGVTHQVWYENAHSTSAKMALVKKYNLRGVALWRLGYEDPNIWKVIQQGF